MRKVGLSALASGTLLSLLLFFARRTEWFAREAARGMSDFAELVESAFWAALAVTAFGLLLLLLSLRPSEAPPENETPTPLARAWVCPACGAENTEPDRRCQVCGTRLGWRPVPAWRCPVCGAENPETETRCAACQRSRFAP